jgi:predicted nuclease of predicted toxin-antitoxin system
MAIRFLVDENIGIELVLGLRLLGHENIEHVTEKFGSGALDEEWLEYAGKNKLAIITKDKSIRKNPLEKALIKKYNLVAFYLGGNQTGIAEISKQIIISWKKMETKVRIYQKKSVPAAFRIRLHGGTFDEIPLD